MRKLLSKEMKLTASPLSYVFILGALLTFAPGYPILLGAFFTTLGIFYSFQSMRENNDIAYAMLLPVAKGDVVKSKFCFTVFIELCSFALMAVVTVLRMTVLQDAAVYTANVMMRANLVFLGFALLVFGLFNFCFVRGFFKTAYYFAKPFICYCIVTFLVIATAEALHHIPGLELLNAPGGEALGVQLAVFCAGLASFVLLTVFGLKASIRRFEVIDL